VNLLPNGQGVTNQWTAGTNASDYLETDETPADNDTTYVASTGGAGELQLFAMQSLSDVSVIAGTIAGVAGIVDRREASAGSSSGLVRIYSNGATVDTTVEDISTSYVYRTKLALTDPNTSVAWTTAGVDAMQIGVNEDNAVTMRATLARASVLYAPSTGNIGVGTLLGAGR
jgi:hypothetical protein